MDRKIPFMDSLMFPAVIVRDPGILKELIHVFWPEIHLGEVTTDMTWNEYRTMMTDTKGSTFDTRLKDTQENRIITESLQYRDRTIVFRLQYYQSAEIVDHLKRGARYEDNGRVITLLMTKYQFADNENAVARYVVKNCLSPENEIGGYPVVLVLYYRGKDAGLTVEQKGILEYLKDGYPKNRRNVLISRIEKTMEEIRKDEYWRLHMTFDELVNMKAEENREKYLAMGRAEGKTEGRSEGLIKGRSEGLIQGRSEGIEIGEKREKDNLARKLRQKGYSEEEIQELLS